MGSVESLLDFLTTLIADFESSRVGKGYHILVLTVVITESDTCFVISGILESVSVASVSHAIVDEQS